jgi:hypothetical protein
MRESDVSLAARWAPAPHPVEDGRGSKNLHARSCVNLAFDRHSLQTPSLDVYDYTRNVGYVLVPITFALDDE